MMWLKLLATNCILEQFQENGYQESSPQRHLWEVIHVLFIHYTVYIHFRTLCHAQYTCTILSLNFKNKTETYSPLGMLHLLEKFYPG